MLYVVATGAGRSLEGDGQVSIRDVAAAVEAMPNVRCCKRGKAKMSAALFCLAWRRRRQVLSYRGPKEANVLISKEEECRIGPIDLDEEKRERRGKFCRNSEFEAGDAAG